MGSFKPDGFDPLELEIIESVYTVAWTSIAARDPYRDTSDDPARQEALRRLVFTFVKGPVDFDILCEKVLGSMPESWIPHGSAQQGHKSEGGTPEA